MPYIVGSGTVLIHTTFLKGIAEILYMSDKNTAIERALFEAFVNGIVIGALVAGVMIVSNNFSDVVVLRTTIGAMLLRFSFYMIENAQGVDAGTVGDYLGVTPSNNKHKFRLGKVI